MGMPAPAKTYYTVDEVLAFPEDGNKYELIFGELVVSPTPRFWHQEIVMRLTLYRERVDTYWIVDADTHHVEVWTPESQFPRVEAQRLTWSPAKASPPLIIELAELFAKG